MDERLSRLLDELLERQTIILGQLEPGVQAYRWIQGQLRQIDVAEEDGEQFRRRYKHFYGLNRAHRPPAFYREYFGLMQREKNNPHLTFAQVLPQFEDQLEASFSSKLVATIRPEMPVWDSVIFQNLGLSPVVRPGDRAVRLQQACSTYESLHAMMESMLQDQRFQHLRTSFDDRFPGAPVSDMKVLDFYIWQNR